jgi:biotin operon repressor
MPDFLGAEQGFVKVWRCLLESKLAGLSLSHQGLALNLLLRANHSTFHFHKQEIKPGETILSQHRFSERLGISRTTLSAKLKDLKAVGFINFRTNKNYTFITIKNWSKYQNVEENKRKSGHTQSEQITQ